MIIRKTTKLKLSSGKKSYQLIIEVKVDNNNIKKVDNLSGSSSYSLNDSRQEFVSKLTRSLSELNSPQIKPSLWQWFCNLSISRKQLIALIASEIISILGLTVVSRFLITSSLQAIFLEQAKSELAVTDMAYNIKVNQMGFGFRGQSDNTSIIKAARLYDSGNSLSQSLKTEVKQILANEIKASNIEYATLVGKDYKIIANANAQREGEVFNPDNLVSEVFNFPKQIKASRIVKWAELSRESPPLPTGFKNQDALIRYVVTPVKDPTTNVVIGALVSGDIVNGKDSIVRDVLQSTGGGYSAVYVRKPTGKFMLARALSSNESTQNKNKNASIKLPEEGQSLLQAAVSSQGKIVTAQMQIGGQSYTVAAKGVPSKIFQADNETVASFSQPPVAILVRGTPETALNQLLTNSFWVQLLAIIVAIIIIIICALLLKQTIINPIQKLQQTAVKYAAGNHTIRASVFATDEIGQLATTFNELTDKVTQHFSRQEDDVKIAKLVREMTARCRGSLNSQYILNAAVTSICSTIQADRVIVYKFDDNWQGTIIAEALNPEFPATLGFEILDPCFSNSYVEKYRKGRIQAISDIYNSGLTDCHITQLEEFEVKANLVAPILINNKLYGLLIAHQCSSPREWEEFEISLFKQVAIPIGYALEQASLTEKIDNASSLATLVSDEQRQQVSNLLQDISGISSGNLTIKAKVVSGEIGIIAANFNSIVDNVAELVAKVQSGAFKVNTAVNENQEAIQHLSQQVQEQVSDIQNILGKVQQLTSSVKTVSENAQQAAKFTNTAFNNAHDSKTAIDSTVENISNLRSCINVIAKKIKRLGEFSQEIASTVSSINEIGTRTNLLAVNAELQAGKLSQNASFVTFATDLGDLAIRYANTTHEIEQIIKKMQKETQDAIKVVEQGILEMVKGSDIAENAQNSWNQILNLSQQINELIQSVSQTTVSQLQTSQAVTQLMQSISQTSESNSDYSHKVAQSLQKTVDFSKELQIAIGQFKIS